MGSTTANALRYGPCVMRGSHSFTCHLHTNYTCLYSPATRHHRPLAGTHCAYPRSLATKGWLGWVDLGRWPHTEINVQHRIQKHPPKGLFDLVVTVDVQECLRVRAQSWMVLADIINSGLWWQNNNCRWEQVLLVHRVYMLLQWRRLNNSTVICVHRWWSDYTEWRRWNTAECNCSSEAVIGISSDNSNSCQTCQQCHACQHCLTCDSWHTCQQQLHSFPPRSLGCCWTGGSFLWSCNNGEDTC